MLSLSSTARLLDTFATFQVCPTSDFASSAPSNSPVDRGDPRFTLRCLRADLDIDIPTIPRTLDDIEHDLLEEAQLISCGHAPTSRVSAIDDQVLLKLKPSGRWRGAGWSEGSLLTSQMWVVAGGWREDGSPDDFYSDLKRSCQAERRRRNGEKRDLEPGKTCFSQHLNPAEEDFDRLKVDRATQKVRDSERDIPDLVARARRDVGTVFTVTALGAEVEALVLRNGLDELYLAIRVTGSAPTDAHFAILSLACPGLLADDWEPLTLAPHRGRRPNEVIWLTLLEVPKLGL